MKTESQTPKKGKRKITRPVSIPVNRLSAQSLKKELNSWLDGKTVWTHDDWLKLLSNLRSKGYNDLIDTPKGQEAIGLYLEANRELPSC